MSALQDQGVTSPTAEEAAVFADEPACLDETAWMEASAEEAARVVSGLPLSTRFRLRASLTPVQHAFLELHGFILFARVASYREVQALLGAFEAIQEKLFADKVEKVFGVPVWIGRGPNGQPWLQRMGFASVFSDVVATFVRDARFEPIRTLIGEDARIGDREKDGVVVNRYVRAPGSLRPDLAWHTDALRDVFYNRKMPGPMLNVGLHFERIRPNEGGLRVLPGTHRQGAWSTLFSKIHFVSNSRDPQEVAVETWPGDLTVHDGRMWHRVEGSPYEGARSVRHSMYVPYVCDRYAPKDANSKTPLYLQLFDAIFKWRAARERRRLAQGL